MLGFHHRRLVHDEQRRPRSEAALDEIVVAGRAQSAAPGVVDELFELRFKPRKLLPIFSALQRQRLHLRTQAVGLASVVRVGESVDRQRPYALGLQNGTRLIRRAEDDGAGDVAGEMGEKR